MCARSCCSQRERETKSNGPVQDTIWTLSHDLWNFIIRTSWDSKPNRISYDCCPSISPTVQPWVATGCRESGFTWKTAQPGTTSEALLFAQLSSELHCFVPLDIVWSYFSLRYTCQLRSNNNMWRSIRMNWISVVAILMAGSAPSVSLWRVCIPAF